jgi:AcrR family transcriptional regulator
MRPQPTTRRPRFTREQIAATALEIADRDGIEAVSMRRVAAELGAGTMTLYHYVETKDDLLALMDDAIMGEVVVPDDELPDDDWREAVATIARFSHAAFVRHRWALEGLRGQPFGPNGVRHFEQSLRAVELTGLPPQERMTMLATVDDYVFGFVLRTLGDSPERVTEEGDSEAAAIFDYLNRKMDSGEFPAMARLLGSGDVESRMRRWEEISANWANRFEHGLQLLLDGIELELDRRGLPDGGARSRRRHTRSSARSSSSSPSKR